MLSGRLTEKIRVSTKSPNHFDKNFLKPVRRIWMWNVRQSLRHTSHTLDSTCRSVSKIPSYFGLDRRSYNASKRQKYITKTETIQNRGFIEGPAPGKLAGCERDLAINLPGCFRLLFLLSFIRKTKTALLKNSTDLLHKNLMKPQSIAF